MPFFLHLKFSFLSCIVFLLSIIIIHALAYIVNKNHKK
nr:MAG TPA: hypothetical protein [Caudoviricetes sp.]DAF07306.1 MAG TPA: hypothetical protein [Caudoviricetes sp.]